jgi:hypothetical protein
MAELLTDENLRPRIRQIAQQLDDDLCRARDATGGWSDAALTDRLACQALQRALDQLSATGCWGEANRVPSSELWRIAAPWLETGLLQLRARTKPSGYAGDFEMLSQICDRQVCEHPLGVAFDRFFQSQAAPQAVRCRTDLIAGTIADFVRLHSAGPVRVVSVGSGPAIDIERACRALTPAQRQALQITLLDLDPAALDYARSRLAPWIEPVQLQLVRENLFRLAQPGRGSDLFADVDVLVCLGLFDYLDDAAAAALLSRFWQSLRPEGQAWVFNFAPHNPSRAYMEWIGNWYLIYRTAEQMREVAVRAGIPHQHVEISAEPSGVNLCWQITRP